jgi:hypothetical protein
MSRAVSRSGIRRGSPVDAPNRRHSEPVLQMVEPTGFGEASRRHARLMSHCVRAAVSASG